MSTSLFFFHPWREQNFFFATALNDFSLSMCFFFFFQVYQFSYTAFYIICSLETPWVQLRVIIYTWLCRPFCCEVINSSTFYTHTHICFCVWTLGRHGTWTPPRWETPSCSTQAGAHVDSSWWEHTLIFFLILDVYIFNNLWFKLVFYSVFKQGWRFKSLVTAPVLLMAKTYFSVYASNMYSDICCHLVVILII